MRRCYGGAKRVDDGGGGGAKTQCNGSEEGGRRLLGEGSGEGGELLKVTKVTESDWGEYRGGGGGEIKVEVETAVQEVGRGRKMTIKGGDMRQGR